VSTKEIPSLIERIDLHNDEHAVAVLRTFPAIVVSADSRGG
jgi:hypothetical protein